VPFVGGSIDALSVVIEAREVVAPSPFGRAGELGLERNAGDGRPLRRIALGRSNRHWRALLSVRLKVGRGVVLCVDVDV
jgi:hypothetical protein